jgi:hypothetical protein
VAEALTPEAVGDLGGDNDLAFVDHALGVIARHVPEVAFVRWVSGSLTLTTPPGTGAATHSFGRRPSRRPCVSRPFCRWPRPRCGDRGRARCRATPARRSGLTEAAALQRLRELRHYPAHEGFGDTDLSPAAGRWDAKLGEYVLDWDDIRDSPIRTLQRWSSAAPRSAMAARSASGTPLSRPRRRESPRRSGEARWHRPSLRARVVVSTTKRGSTWRRRVRSRRRHPMGARRPELGRSDSEQHLPQQKRPAMPAFRSG